MIPQEQILPHRCNRLLEKWLLLNTMGVYPRMKVSGGSKAKDTKVFIRQLSIEIFFRFHDFQFYPSWKTIYLLNTSPLPVPLDSRIPAILY